MARSIKHLLLTTVEDPYNLNAWSGIVFAMREALERNVERVSVFQPPRPSRNIRGILMRQFHGGGNNPRYPLWMTETTLRRSGRAVGVEIDRVQPDAVLSISSQCLGYLDRPGMPQYMFSDSPWIAWLESYSEYERPHVRAPQYAALEARTARRIDGLFFGSDWAVREGIAKYGLSGGDAGKVHSVQLGANWVPDVGRDELVAHIRARNADTIQLLFIGMEWERKGGPLAVEVTKLLRDAGERVMLHVVGCRPALPALLTEGEGAIVTIHGRLDKNDPVQRAAMQRLFVESHLLIVPTRVECYGIVFAEAHAFGLPPVSRAVNSLPSIVLDGETGILEPADAPASLYADRILALMRDRSAYVAMTERVLSRYDTVLNWDSAVQAMVRQMDADLGRGDNRAAAGAVLERV